VTQFKRQSHCIKRESQTSTSFTPRQAPGFANDPACASRALKSSGLNTWRKTQAMGHFTGLRRSLRKRAAHSRLSLSASLAVLGSTVSAMAVSWPRADNMSARLACGLDASSGIAIVGSTAGFISYFLHEIIWSKIKWGQSGNAASIRQDTAAHRPSGRLSAKRRDCR